MGFAIIGLTFVIKALLFPLAYKSYASMSKMKALQPEMEKIKERVGDDRMKMQQEMMALYKREKVNPAAGCLPILLQIPIFFSLYKVIFVTIELRHAPFFGWIQDLSAPDPTSILNLFGLLPWAPPGHGSSSAIISIGVWPILLGISMWLQQKLNPTPTDKTQAMIFAWMPWIFMFMLGSFASGLVIYWVANNTITFTQQYIDHAPPGREAERARQHPRAAEETAQGGAECRRGSPPLAPPDQGPRRRGGRGGRRSRPARRCPGTGSGRSRTRRRRSRPGSTGWAPCANFSRGAKSPELMAIRARVDEAAGRVTLTHPRRAAAHRRSRRSRRRRAAGRLGARRSPTRTGPRPAFVVRAPRRHDRQRLPVDLDPEPRQPRRARRERLGQPLAMERFRGNLWLDGLAPFAEFDLVGRDIRIGARRLRVRERITRCKATTVDPDTGVSDADTLGALRAGWGHQDFGVYAEVVEPRPGRGRRTRRGMRRHDGHRRPARPPDFILA